MDALRTGLGGEITDGEVKSASTRPQWLLKPLPLTQIARWVDEPTGLPSLQSLALASLSRNFHLLSPEDMATLPPHLAAKVITRLASDRGYDLTDPTDPRPDTATLWSFAALSEPELIRREAPTWTLELPQDALLLQLPGFRRVDHPEHPFTALPRLFRTLRPRSLLLTTLTLEALDDVGLQALKHCPNLTVLCTPGASFTDDGVRMLASSTSVPEKKGAWGLRAWYMRDTKKVGDRAMRALVRFGGLALVDLRGTSCTTAAMQVFNRANSAWESAVDMQPCTAGLRGLFSSEDADALLENLSLTLLAPDIPTSADAGAQSRRYLSLHLRPAKHELEDNWQHLPPRSSLPKGRAAFNEVKSFNAAYGTLYGSGVNLIQDEARDFRQRVKTALEIQAEEEYYDDCVARGVTPPLTRQEKAYEATKAYRAEWNKAKKRKREQRQAAKERRAQKGRGGGRGGNRANGGDGLDCDYGSDGDEGSWKDDGWIDGGRLGRSKQVWIEGQSELRHRTGGVVKLTEEEEAADERSRRFYTAHERKTRTVKEVAEEEVKSSTRGKKELMFVRMVPTYWREMKWIPTAMKEQAPASQQVGVRRKAEAGGDVYDLLASVLDADELSSAFVPSASFPPTSSVPPSSTPPPPSQPRTSSPAPPIATPGQRHHPFFATRGPASSAAPSSSPASSQGKPKASNPFAKPTQSQTSSQGAAGGLNPFKQRGKAELSSNGVRKLSDRTVAKVLGEKQPNESEGRRRNVFRKL